MNNDEGKNLSLQIERIVSLFSEILNNDQVTSNDNFFDLGGDSFDAIRLTTKLNEKLQLIEIFENPTAEKLAKHLISGKRENEIRIVSLNNEERNDARTVFVGVPYGGGEATIFRNLFITNKTIKVYGVDFGDYHSEKIIDFSIIVKKIVEQIRELETDKVVVYGHCAGAATAACIASEISKFNDVSLVIAASVPIDNTDVAINMMETTSNEEWGEYLRSLGAFNGLTNAEIADMLIRGRRDHRLSIEAYKKLKQQPVKNILTLLLLGDNDSVTENIEDVVVKWSSYVDALKTIVIHDGDHYFLRTHSREIEENIETYILNRQ